MSLNTKKDDDKTVVQSIAKPAEPVKVKLELATLERHVDAQGNLFEKDRVYIFNEEDAKRYLMMMANKLPVFIRHKEKQKQRIVIKEVEPDVDMTALKPVSNVQSEEQQILKRIEIGTDSELEAIGVNLSDEGVEI